MNFKTPYLERGRRIAQSVFAQGSDSHTPGLVPTVLTQNLRTSPKSCSESPTFQIVFVFWVGSVVYFSLNLCFLFVCPSTYLSMLVDSLHREWKGHTF